MEPDELYQFYWKRTGEDSVELISPITNSSYQLLLLDYIERNKIFDTISEASSAMALQYSVPSGNA